MLSADPDPPVGIDNGRDADGPESQVETAARATLILGGRMVEKLTPGWYVGRIPTSATDREVRLRSARRCKEPLTRITTACFDALPTTQPADEPSSLCVSEPRRSGRPTDPTIVVTTMSPSRAATRHVVAQMIQAARALPAAEIGHGRPRPSATGAAAVRRPSSTKAPPALLTPTTRPTRRRQAECGRGRES
jgi:hypothetical protein